MITILNRETQERFSIPEELIRFEKQAFGRARGKVLLSLRRVIYKSPFDDQAYDSWLLVTEQWEGDAKEHVVLEPNRFLIEETPNS